MLLILPMPFVFYTPETQRKKSDRVLVFSELGISRGATVIIAYLMKRQKWPLKVMLISPLIVIIDKFSHGSLLFKVSETFLCSFHYRRLSVMYRNVDTTYGH